MDTFAANKHLGFDADLRDYRSAALILRMLAPKSIILATNNPDKVSKLRKWGIDVTERAALVATVNPHNADYLDAKAKKAGHILP